MHPLVRLVDGTSRLSITALFVVAVAGCGDAPTANAPEASTPDHFSLHTQDGGALSVLVTPTAASGSDVSFARYTETDGEFVRGSAFGKPIYLTLEPDRAVGVLGAQAFDLKVLAEGDRLHFTGVVGGKSSDFWFGPREITGKVGLCGYELHRVADAYQGSSGCSASMRITSVEVPASLLRWSPPELGAALGIFLSGERG